MTRPGRIFSTTAFRLSAIYLAVFSLFAVAFVVSVSYSTRQLLDQQLRDTIGAEIQGLAEQARIGGLRGLVEAVERRSRSPGASLYLLTDGTGRILAGNVSEVPHDLLARTDPGPITVPYQREEGGGERVAMVELVPLAGGLKMLIGRDISERDRFRQIVGTALFWAVVLMAALGLVSWLFVSRRVLKRIDSASAASRRIMEGDLSGRLEITGTGDEFDRLAENLNAMLDRIEALLYSLKDVSDNIAHDLKTPLTRLRTRVEVALTGEPDVTRYRNTLEATIEESDQLIQTFNALLMIARLEAGAPDGAMQPVEAERIVEEMVELYEPVAEEAGVTLRLGANPPAKVKANRELLGQTLANLIDNAIKYGRPDSGSPEVTVTTVREGADWVLTVADNGPGVPEADRDRVLKRFVRLEKSRSAPGSGLGLSLVAAVVRLHGGRLELADNAPGLRVILRLPAEG